MSLGDYNLSHTLVTHFSKTRIRKEHAALDRKERLVSAQDAT